MPNVQHKRGTRAALDALASGSSLLAGQIYVITDEDRIAVALTTTTYETYAKQAEIPVVSSLHGVDSIVPVPHDFTDGSWFTNGVTVTALNGYDAAGKLKAVKLVETTTTRHVFGLATLTVTADVSCVLSAVVQPITGGGAATRYPILYCSGGAYQDARRVGVVFNPSTGDISAATTAGSPTPTFHDAWIENLPDDRYRISIAATVGNGDTSCGFFLGWSTDFTIGTGVAPSYAGDDLSGFWVSDIQLEQNKKFPGMFGRERTLNSLAKATLGTAADKMIYATAADTWAEATVTAAGRAILDDADAAAQRTTLGLKTGATTAIHVGTSAPGSPATGDLWVDTN